MESYIFSGIGHAEARFKITNNEIGTALHNYHLSGFSNDKVVSSRNYQEFLKRQPGKTAFDYFTEEKMGFSVRHHVTPFPPTNKKIYFAESSLDLAVRAVRNALNNSGVHPSQVAAWFLSTVSPHEQAPGMAASMKSYLVSINNTTPAFTLTSGCAGFNINLERAVEYLKFHPESTHVVVVHSETMSSFLTNRIKFVPFVTFGDGAAAVVLSKVETPLPQGLLNIVNYHDVSMVDFVGVDKRWDLFMDDNVIKDRAIINIPAAAESALRNTGWQTTDIDFFVPHQTGNAILLPAIEKLGIPRSKLFTDAQMQYGNVSGATVPMSLSLLHQQNKLSPGTKILSAMAGVGGNYGAFTYLVPEFSVSYPNKIIHEMEGKTAMVLGAQSGLGRAIAEKLIEYGARVFAVITGNGALPHIQHNHLQYIFCDFSSDKDVNSLAIQLSASEIAIDYLIQTSSELTQPENNNFFSPLEIIKASVPQKPQCIVAVGNISENVGFPDKHDYVSSLAALHGSLASASGEFLSYGIRLIYYIPGFTEDDTTLQMDERSRFRLMMQAGQEQVLSINELSDRIVQSLYILKVENTWSYYENAMVLRCDGFKPMVDL